MPPLDTFLTYFLVHLSRFRHNHRIEVMGLASENIAEILLKNRLGLIAYLSTVTHNHHLSEDVFQETCVKALSKASDFESQRHLINWFRVAARNRAIDIIRTRDGKYVTLSVEVLELLEKDLESSTDENEQRIRQLMDCISKVTPRNRELIRLRYFEGCSGQELSRKLGRKIETIYQAVSRIHKSLHKCMTLKMQQTEGGMS